MPRQPRQFEVGEIYHVLNRGHEKRQIYFDDNDYLRFIEALYYFNDQDTIVIREARPRNRGQTPGSWLQESRAEREPLVELLAFALMPNHYHLIVREIARGGVSKFMQKLGDGYTGYFNEKYHRSGVGGIFQSRYKAVASKDDTQLGNVFVYVHTNPIELKEAKWKDFKVKNPSNAINWLESYKWSSYHDYVGNPIFPTITQRDFFLDFYGGERGCRQAIEDWITFKAENAQLGSEIIE